MLACDVSAKGVPLPPLANPGAVDAAPDAVATLPAWPTTLTDGTTNNTAAFVTRSPIPAAVNSDNTPAGIPTAPTVPGADEKPGAHDAPGSLHDPTRRVVSQPDCLLSIGQPDQVGSSQHAHLPTQIISPARQPRYVSFSELVRKAALDSSTVHTRTTPSCTTPHHHPPAPPLHSSIPALQRLPLPNEAGTSGPSKLTSAIETADVNARSMHRHADMCEHRDGPDIARLDNGTGMPACGQPVMHAGVEKELLF